MIATPLLALALGGCAHFAVQDPTTDPGSRMTAIADRFEQDFHQGGMAGVITDINKCYDATSAPIIRVNALRDCMVLDYTGYQTDRAIGQKLLKGPPLPFFELQAVRSRLNHYAHLAEFAGPADAGKFLGAGYDLVSIYMARMNQAPIVVHAPAPDFIMGR